MSSPRDGLAGAMSTLICILVALLVIYAVANGHAVGRGFYIFMGWPI